MVRLVNSGTEAGMSAIRIARGFTGRSKLIKFAGCYHGHADYLLVKAGSGATTLGVPDSAGIPPDFAQLTVTLPYNDTDTFAQVMSDIGDEVAAVIVEPIAGNMGVVPPRHGFLEALRELTHKHNAVLIFDEVITGFRVCYGGAQTLYNIQPDMTVLGKIIGGGFPIGAYGGRREIMEQVAPLGPVYQAGTLSGNPVAVSAGIATLSVLKREIPYPTLERLSEKLATNMLEVAQRAGVQVQINRIGSMMTIFFSDSPVFDYQSALQADCNQFAKFFHAMLDKGIYLPPSQFEAMFVSMAHTDEDINATIEAARIAFSEVYSCM
ncbi:MAG TPA: aminotransferase class III-fold pyridoxal phosphate-dependent enzyme, partial [Armatimonadetes bacterium]|nr:aminotransferase class III-fold pyridoxal phosphate-dependent enzyme [Armatimonadota bacterium]